MIYLIIDIGSKVHKVLAATRDKVKAEHWCELFDQQGTDVCIAELNSDMQEMISTEITNS